MNSGNPKDALYRHTGIGRQRKQRHKNEEGKKFTQQIRGTKSQKQP